MAKLSDLVSCCADISGVPEPTVREISRRLREAKLIGTGKGGRYGGADMTANDAASLLAGLLIASTSSVAITELGSITKRFLEFRAYSSRREPPLPLGYWPRALALPLLYRLENGHKFKDALTALIQSSANGDLEQATKKWAADVPAAWFTFQVEIARPRPHPEAKIEFSSASFDQLVLWYLSPRDVRVGQFYMPAYPRKWSELRSNPSEFDLRVIARIEEGTIAAIGRVLENEVP
jgi:hypothetical protein